MTNKNIIYQTNPRDAHAVILLVFSCTQKIFYFISLRLQRIVWSFDSLASRPGYLESAFVFVFPWIAPVKYGVVYRPRVLQFNWIYGHSILEKENKPTVPKPLFPASITPNAICGAHNWKNVGVVRHCFISENLEKNIKVPALPHGRRFSMHQIRLVGSWWEKNIALLDQLS